MNSFLKPFNTLGAETAFYFEEIVKNLNRFDFKELAVERIAGISKKEFLEYFKKIFIVQQNIFEVHFQSEKFQELNVQL